MTYKIQKPLNLVVLCEFLGLLDETPLEFSRLTLDLGGRLVKLSLGQEGDFGRSLGIMASHYWKPHRSHGYGDASTLEVRYLNETPMGVILFLSCAVKTTSLQAIGIPRLGQPLPILF